MADSSTTARTILDLLPGRHWARPQLHAGIRDVAVASILMKSLHSLEGGPGKAERGCWRAQNWIADSSTPGWPIPDLKARRRWSQRQLYAGIRYVSIASILMQLLFTLQGVLGRQKGWCWRSQNSMSDSSTTASAIPDLKAGRRWTRCQLHAGIENVTVASILMKSLSTLGGGPGQAKRGCW